MERAIATGGIYVTTVDPNATLQIMRTELNRLQTELIEPAGLERLIQQFITEYFLKNETNGDQANFLARAAIYQGDYRIADRFVEDLRRVRPDDVRRVARQYMRDMRFAYLGNPAKLSRALIDQF
jgi:zinc protease